MAIQLTNILSLQTYFTALATGANHHKEIDGIKFGDNEVLMAANRSDMEARVLWVSEYENWTAQGTQDNLHTRKPFKMVYMKVPASDLFADKQTAKDQCEAVMRQIIAKIIVDKQAGLVLTKLDSIKAEVGEYMVGSTNYCGCEVSLEILDNTGFQYDATKWEE